MTDDMTGSVELTGTGAPPMANGELLFEAPWQGRAFGMARALCEAGMFNWDEFRLLLISNIAIWEQLHSGASYSYYEIFLQTLSMLLANKDLCVETELVAREAEFFARPHGHDH
jgi:nitrile hydratase accessory protein